MQPVTNNKFYSNKTTFPQKRTIKNVWNAFLHLISRGTKLCLILLILKTR